MDDIEKPRENRKKLPPVIPDHGPADLWDDPTIVKSTPPQCTIELFHYNSGAAVPHRRIFISYRRQETQYPANWLYTLLVNHYGNDQVFMDVAIQPGDDFVKKITDEINSSNVLLVLIGDRWLTITDPKGNRRIDDPSDFVRREIEAALAHKVHVIPTLFDGAKMPRYADLPTSIAGLAHHQAHKLSPNRFALDVDELLKVLDEMLSSSAG